MEPVKSMVLRPKELLAVMKNPTVLQITISDA